MNKNLVQLAISAVLLGSSSLAVHAGQDNRLAHLQRSDPYYPSQQLAKLITPQWVGDPGVDAVVVWGIDDLRRNYAHYDNYVRPMLERMRDIDGRTPLSIFTNDARHDDHLLVERWAKEGVNLEVHTYDHPCPLLIGGNFPAALSTYETGVDVISNVRGMKPVAYRMPCLDVWNTNSPRFYHEIFNRTTKNGNFLTMSSSVTLVFDDQDEELPRELVIDEAGRPRFSKYMNVPGFDTYGRMDYQYANFVTNYPYPYVVANIAWESPMLTSDHTMAVYDQHYGGDMVDDWRAAIDATVVKRGLLSTCFHPTQRISPEALAGLVDHAVETHGSSILFLNYREVQQRIDKNLLAGHPLRAEDGNDNGVRLMDLTGNGYMDVVIGNDHARITRTWNADDETWHETSFPVLISAGAQFGILNGDGNASLLVRTEEVAGVWHFRDGEWREDERGLDGLPHDLYTQRYGIDRGVRLRDLDGSGVCELIVANDQRHEIYRWHSEDGWQRLPANVPAEVQIVDAAGRDGGLRFVDVNGNGYDDLIFSNDDRLGLYYFQDLEQGWQPSGLVGRRGELENELPPIVRHGMNNGAWFDDTRMWVQNEETGHKHNHTTIVSFEELMEWAGQKVTD